MLCYFYAFQLNIDRNTAVPSLVRVYVCLSGCVYVMSCCGGGGLCLCVSVCVCVCVCLSVCTVLCKCVCVCVCLSVGLSAAFSE